MILQSSVKCRTQVFQMAASSLRRKLGSKKTGAIVIVPVSSMYIIPSTEEWMLQYMLYSLEWTLCSQEDDCQMNWPEYSEM